MATKVDTVVSIVLDASGVAVGFKDISGQVRNLQGQFLKLKDGMTQVEKGSDKFAESLGTVVLAAKKQNDALKSVSRETSTFKGTLEGMFRPVTALNQAFGVLQQSLYIIQRAFSLTVGSAMELELQVARITTVLDKSEVGQVDFAKRILDMQATFGANPTEAAKGFYEAIASGATNAAGSIALMNTAQKLAIGGLLPLDKALSGLTSIMASYGYTADETKYISDAFFIAAAKGKTNVEELTMEIGNVASISQQAGVSFEELVSAISAVTLGGKRTAEATTSVRNAINALLTPTEDLQFVYKQLGISSITAEIRQRGLAAVYKDVYGYVNNNADALSKLVGRVEAISAVVALTSGKQKTAYQEMISSITDSNKKMGDTTEKAFKLLEQTSANRMEIAKGKILASFTEISNAAMKLIIPIAELGAGILDKLMKPIVATSNAISSMIDGMNSLMPTLAAFGATIAVFKAPAIFAFFTALAPLLKAVAIPAAIVAAKFIGIAAAITTVTVLFDQIIRNFRLIPDIFDYVISSIDQFVISMAQKLAGLQDVIVKFAQEFAAKFPNISETLGLKIYTDAPQQQVKKLGDDLDKAAEKAKKAKEKILKEWDMGAIKGIKDAFSSLSGALSGAPEVPGPSRPTGAPQLPIPAQAKPVDISAAREAANKAQEQLNSILDGTRDLEKEIALSKAYGTDSMKESMRLEIERVDTLAKQLEKTKQLSDADKERIKKFKETAGEALEIRIRTEEIKQATDFVNSATGGADAVVGNAIKRFGEAFGPQGQLVASIINILRQGKDFMSKLGSDLIKIIVELPLKVAEGAVGLVEGLLQGIIDMLGDPARLAKIITAFSTIGPKIITSIVKALPILLKMLLDPKFWVELASQIVRSIFDALKEMIYAIGDLFASIFSGDIFDGIGEAVENMGNSIGDGIRDATKAVTGFTQQLFGVQEDVAGQEKDKGAGTDIRKAFDYGAKKTRGLWKDITKFLVDTFNLLKQIIIAPFEFAALVFKNTFDLFAKTLEASIGLLGVLLQSVGMTFEAAANITGTILSTAWQGAVIVFEGIVNLFNSAWNTFKNVFMAVFNFAKSIFQGVIDAFKAVFNFFKTLFDDPIKAFKQLFEDFKNIFSNIWDSFKEIPTKLWNGLKDGVGIIFDTFKSLGSAIWEGLKNVGRQIFDWAKSIGSTIYDGFSEFFGKIADGFRNFGRNIWEGFKQIIKDTVGKLADWLGLAEGGIVPGTARAPGDSGRNDIVPALLSPGEAVIPRSLMANPEINTMIRDLLKNRQMPISSISEAVPRISMANGGMVPALVGGGGTSFGDTNVNVVLQIETNQQIDESFIRQRLMPALKSELKASSLRGDFVLSAKGVRR
jgi:hypothetical protein